MTFNEQTLYFSECVENDLPINSTNITLETSNANESLEYIKQISFVVISFILVTSIIIIIFKVCNKQRKNSFAVQNKSDIFENETTTVLELNESILQKERLLRNTAIVLLYVKETESHASFMAEFKKSLEKCTGCEVTVT